MEGSLAYSMAKREGKTGLQECIWVQIPMAANKVSISLLCSALCFGQTRVMTMQMMICCGGETKRKGEDVEKTFEMKLMSAFVWGTESMNEAQAWP